MPVRLSGLATGLDTDTLVKQLMMAKKMPIDRLKQDRTSLEWKRDSYREMNTLMAKLRDAANKIRFNSTMEAKSATLSNYDAFTATPNASASPSSFSLKVNQLATQAVASSGSEVTTTTFSSAADSTLTVNGVNITISQNSSMTDIVNKINAESANTGGVTASFDDVTKRLYLTHPKTGATDSTISVGGDAGLLTELNMTAATYQGQNAMVDYTDAAGNTIAVTQQTNTFTLNNVNITLKQKVVDSSGNPINVNVKVEADVDRVYDAIEEFVNTYNEVIDLVNKKTSEQVNRDYKPLTEDQKAEMKENEIEKWEEKAKSGLLRRDSTLTGALSDFRNLLLQPVQGIAAGNYDSLYDIGISTAKPGSYANYMENGKLYIDETKLKEALASNPDQVADLFTKAVDSGDDTKLSGGFAERLYQAANTTVSRLTKLAGSTANLSDGSQIGLKITDLGKKIDLQSSKLAEYEQQYYNQFAKLESMMNQFNSQSAWLASAFGGGGGY